MKVASKLFPFALFICFVILFPVLTKADPAQNPQAAGACADVTDPDRKNLCLVKSADKDKKFGYENKDHRNYYCSLVKDRDLQTMCYAIVSGKMGSCDLIVNPDVEKECKASF